ncbi:unnamed protein product [Didymodactylos carnosus]|uniref:Uncharacterized protein n=1 Tax=Didymodactylos carnosus TaxID=1234261 RepID=A0A8S2TLZ7_9BILA|nr:unnamed protein product [Didymodactylos carnosus]CAF4290401.1 unnamed protein product [Didymodactylos carnosus]
MSMVNNVDESSSGNEISHIDEHDNSRVVLIEDNNSSTSIYADLSRDLRRSSYSRRTMSRQQVRSAPYSRRQRQNSPMHNLNPVTASQAVSNLFRTSSSSIPIVLPEAIVDDESFIDSFISTEPVQPLFDLIDTQYRYENMLNNSNQHMFDYNYTLQTSSPSGQHRTTSTFEQPSNLTPINLSTSRTQDNQLESRFYLNHVFHSDVNNGGNSVDTLSTVDFNNQSLELLETPTGTLDFEQDFAQDSYYSYLSTHPPLLLASPTTTPENADTTTDDQSTARSFRSRYRPNNPTRVLSPSIINSQTASPQLYETSQTHVHTSVSHPTSLTTPLDELIDEDPDDNLSVEIIFETVVAQQESLVNNSHTIANNQSAFVTPPPRPPSATTNRRRQRPAIIPTTILTNRGLRLSDILSIPVKLYNTIKTTQIDNVISAQCYICKSN